MFTLPIHFLLPCDNSCQENLKANFFWILGYFCGSGIGRDQNMFTASAISDGKDSGSGIISEGPFILTFHTDDKLGKKLETTQNQNTVGQSELGFSLDYRISTSCPDLSFTDAA